MEPVEPEAAGVPAAEPAAVLEEPEEAPCGLAVWEGASGLRGAGPTPPRAVPRLYAKLGASWPAAASSGESVA